MQLGSPTHEQTDRQAGTFTLGEFIFPTIKCHNIWLPEKKKALPYILITEDSILRTDGN